MKKNPSGWTFINFPGQGQVVANFYLIGQVSPICAWVSWNEVDSLLLQGIQWFCDVIRQDVRFLAEVALQVRPRLSLVGDGKLVVARGNGWQVRDRIPAGESSPRCAWPPGGCGVAAPVQHNLLEMGTLQSECWINSHSNRKVKKLQPGNCEEAQDRVAVAPLVLQPSQSVASLS